MALLEAFQEGNYSKVINEWQRGQYQVKADPDEAYIAAASLFRIGNNDEAYSICHELEGIHGNNPNFLSMYAAIARRMGLQERAEQLFKKALEIEPSAKDVRNNYSNLLIDQKKYQAAKEILLDLLKDDPNYQDAKLNYERAIELEEIENIKLRDETRKKDDIFMDPIDEAFELQEVLQCGSKVGSATAALNELVDNTGSSKLEEADYELVKLAEEQIKERQYRGACDLLEKAKKRQGLNCVTYKLASDAYIGIENYKEAEIMALIAYINGEKTIANCVNLASLSAMRKDQLMARFWLMEAGKIDKSDVNYIKCKEMLFPNERARDSDQPFKISG